MNAWLCLYPPDHRHFQELEYAVGSLRAVIAPHSPAYTIAEVTYYTASQILLIASQMSYVLAGASILDPDFPEISGEFHSLYLERLRSVELYYTKTSLEFNRTISNAEPQYAEATIQRIKMTSQLGVMKSLLSLADGSACCSMTLVMPM